MTTNAKMLEPIRLGTMELRNRTSVLAMGMPADNYYMSDALVDYYSQLSHGGVGLVTLGAVSPCDMFDVKHQYPAGGHSVGCWNDDFIPGLTRLTDAIREGGAKSCAQLDIHYEWREDASKPFESVGPSDGPGGPFVKHLRELTKDEIQIIVKQFGEAALRCKKSGFDSVEIHAGIGYLLCRFLSSFSNRRTDEYGGSIENRCRIVLEIMDECHRLCGDDYPVLVRINADDYMPGGNTIEDAKKVIPLLEQHGAVAINIQAGFHESSKPLVNQFVPAAPLADMTAELKKCANVPVIAGYRIATFEDAERLLQNGVADMIGMGRAQIADPAFVGKVAQGKPEQIRPCICCSRCLDSTFVGRDFTCTVNPLIGTNIGKPEEKPAEQKKHVVIVGAGPGGMEAARVAAIRGHKVTLIDKNKHLGGLLNLAAVLNEFLEPLIDWYTLQMHTLPIDIRLGTEATVELLKQLAPDEIIIAPGAEVVPPDVPGINGKNVIGSSDLKKLVAGKAPKPGFMWKCASIGTALFGNNKNFMRFGMALPWPVRKNVVVIGGQFAGCEVALSMMKGRNITILEEGKRLLEDQGPVTKGTELAAISAAENITVITNAKLLEVCKNGVRYLDKESGEEKFISCQTVMTSVNIVDNKAFFNEVSAHFDSVHIIGDGAGLEEKVENLAPGERPQPYWERARRVREAVADGFRVAMSI